VALNIAVVDPLPLYRQGVVGVLSAAGHAVETPGDVVAWARRQQRTVVLLTLVSEQGWELLARLHDLGGTHLVIALVEGNLVAQGVRAARAGARSVLWRDATEVALSRTLEATIDGQAVMPAAVAAGLAAGVPVQAAGVGLLPRSQLSWLRQLAAGETVAQLADRAGYSEREMFRLLRALYRQMGVGSRIEAIIRAQELGWLRAGEDG
jgi:DNA-binding NarL/FixJ family response regulator